MYELGNSILMCGDSTNAEDVARLMGGEKADMVFTDPPYNVAYTGGMQIKDGLI
jgi:site-specific DNA-methyltransferase (adenine-specific)